MPPFKTWCPSGCWWCCWCWCWCCGWNDDPICCWSWLFIMCCIIGCEKPLTLTLMLCSSPCRRGKCSSAGDGWREPGVRLERLWKLQLLVTRRAGFGLEYFCYHLLSKLEILNSFAYKKSKPCIKNCLLFLTWILCHRRCRLFHWMSSLRLSLNRLSRRAMSFPYRRCPELHRRRKCGERNEKQVSISRNPVRLSVMMNEADVMEAR